MKYIFIDSLFKDSKGVKVMRKYKAILFDLDDTLLNRDKAVDQLFNIILENYYRVTADDITKKMLKKFKEYDKNCYGDGDKIKVLKPFFQEFPPELEMKESNMIDFWDTYFPQCFKPEEEVHTLLDQISQHAKIGLITNGSTQRQKAKIKSSQLESYFETIVISDEVGYSKPEQEIFDIALDRLGVMASETLFIGDDLVKDVKGPQNVGIKSVWFNPGNIGNTTNISPDVEISELNNIPSLI